MMKLDPSDLDQQPSDGAVLLRRGLIGVGGGLLLLFIASLMAGFSYAAISDGNFGLVFIAILAVMVLVFAGVAYAMWRFWPRGHNEPEAPRVKSARMILIAAMVISMPVGIILAASDDSANGVFSNAPITSVIAISLIALWLIPVPVLTWMWWRRVDEHEANAYRDGGFVAVHAYLFLTPAWWIASRAGWVPAQDPMIVFLAVCVVWCCFGFARKYF